MEILVSDKNEKNTGQDKLQYRTIVATLTPTGATKNVLTEKKLHPHNNVFFIRFMNKFSRMGAEMQNSTCKIKGACFNRKLQENFGKTAIFDCNHSALTKKPASHPRAPARPSTSHSSRRRAPAEQNVILRSINPLDERSLHL
ncbi:hypothetical protein NECAME_15701 [Necator americanus]|uniref:Uncharacterized protein n=1 Tax=Necator americanus TaxID=51031 RepID=W2SIR6_NECAM|nr:hypothetical protein NECAME_15701 [Necator americanus]ETN68642.1 hypothetical protein NECAME_15701 [Necator americanus]